MIHVGDCLEVMQGLADNSIDSIVTDPPYGISFMAKRWDYDVPSVEVWRECMRVLKPGGHMLVACGTRTQHRMVVNIEDAGFEVRDVVTWLYGQGFPKSLDVSKAIDKEAGADRTEVVGKIETPGAFTNARGDGRDVAKRLEWEEKARGDVFRYAPATDAAREWEGWGTALKPACEFWTLARKPLSEPTVAKNVLKWGTGGINVDGCRISTEEKLGRVNNPRADESASSFNMTKTKQELNTSDLTGGRFPANLILDKHAAAMLDEQTGLSKPKPARVGKRGGCNAAFMSKEKGDNAHQESNGFCPADQGGGASRFFYVAKASKADRGEGNGHPTVKPTSLMAYLCRLITPPGGTVLDPFAGSGSTGVAAIREGFAFVGIEREAEYAEIAKVRINAAS